MKLFRLFLSGFSRISEMIFSSKRKFSKLNDRRGSEKHPERYRKTGKEESIFKELIIKNNQARKRLNTFSFCKSNFKMFLQLREFILKTFRSRRWFKSLIDKKDGYSCEKLAMERINNMLVCNEPWRR